MGSGTDGRLRAVAHALSVNAAMIALESWRPDQLGSLPHDAAPASAYRNLDVCATRLPPVEDWTGRKDADVIGSPARSPSRRLSPSALDELRDER